MFAECTVPLSNPIAGQLCALMDSNEGGGIPQRAVISLLPLLIEQLAIHSFLVWLSFVHICVIMQMVYRDG